MTLDLLPADQSPGHLIPGDDPAALALAGQVANQYAARDVFSDYRARKAVNTLRQQDGGLALFADYLSAAGIPNPPTARDLAGAPAAWAGVTWGLVSKFRDWLLFSGYAIGSVNLHLTTLRTYAGLAMQAGVIPAGECAAIRAVRGYGRTEGKHVDSARTPARKGAKKALPVSLTPEQAARLKAQPDTPQGRRDALLLCLLLDHGLRVGEVAGLAVRDFDLAAGELRFYRPKVDKNQTHRLTADTLAAARAYLAGGDAATVPAVAQGPALQASRKEGRAPGCRHDGPGAHGARAGSRCGGGPGRAERPRSAALLGDAGRAQRDAAGPVAGRRRVGVAGDTCTCGCADRCRRRCAVAVCGNGEDREPGGAARRAGVARAGNRHRNLDQLRLWLDQHSAKGEWWPGMRPVTS